MTFNSIPFLIFYPIVLLGYFISRKIGGKVGKNMCWVFLLAASYFFYMYSQWMLITLILFTTTVSWLCSLRIENINLRMQQEGETMSDAARKKAKRQKDLLLVLTLVVCFGVLFYFKYANFILSSVKGVQALFSGQPSTFTPLDIMLPVGISFYTFQTLSYVIDVYRGDIKTERHFGYYALFVSFFPQLVAGPIERPGNLLPQIKEFQPISRDNVTYGLSKMAVGFFKKIVVADLISVYVNSIYNGLDTFEVVPALGVVIASSLFAVQIYCDFSGYTDIAIGCAGIMGIRLMKNFDHPYRAKTIKEFWARWHISLSTWFRDYLYFPLGGSRCAKWKHMRNLFIVFLVSGLWHGAAWTFVIWGVIHGLYQIVGILTLPYRNKALEKMHLNPKGLLVGCVRTFLTFVLVDFAWVFFRANSTADMMQLLRSLFSSAGWRVPVLEVLQQMGFTLSGVITTIISIFLLVLLDRTVLHHGEPNREGALYRRHSIVLLVWCVVLAWTILMQNDLGSTFIYFQF